MMQSKEWYEELCKRDNPPENEDIKLIVHDAIELGLLEPCEKHHNPMHAESTGLGRIMYTVMGGVKKLEQGREVEYTVKTIPLDKIPPDVLDAIGEIFGGIEGLGKEHKQETQH